VHACHGGWATAFHEAEGVDKGISAEQMKQSGCVKSRTYQSAMAEYE